MPSEMVASADCFHINFKPRTRDQTTGDAINIVKSFKRRTKCKRTNQERPNTPQKNGETIGEKTVSYKIDGRDGIGSLMIKWRTKNEKAFIAKSANDQKETQGFIRNRIQCEKWQPHLLHEGVQLHMVHGLLPHYHGVLYAVTDGPEVRHCNGVDGGSGRGSTLVVGEEGGG